MPPCWHRSHKTRTGSQQPARPGRHRENSCKADPTRNKPGFLNRIPQLPGRASAAASVPSSKAAIQEEGAGLVGLFCRGGWRHLVPTG